MTIADGVALLHDAITSGRYTYVHFLCVATRSSGPKGPNPPDQPADQLQLQRSQPPLLRQASSTTWAPAPTSTSASSTPPPAPSSTGATCGAAAPSSPPHPHFQQPHPHQQTMATAAAAVTNGPSQPPPLLPPPRSSTPAARWRPPRGPRRRWRTSIGWWAGEWVKGKSGMSHCGHLGTFVLIVYQCVAVSCVCRCVDGWRVLLRSSCPSCDGP